MSATRPPQRLAASTTAISLATAASRLLGFIRDLLIAKLFGTGPQAQAFVVAFRLPNLLRDLVAEGAVTSAMVPVLSAYRATKSPQEFWRLAQTLWVRVIVAATGLGMAGALLAPWLVRAIAPGFVIDAEKFALTVTLTRWLFPFITLVGLWAYFMGLLNSLRHFALPALGPAVLNLAMIAGCVWLVPVTQPPVLGVVWAILVGGVIQLVLPLPQAIAAGFRWQVVWHHPASRDVMRLLAPRLVGSAVHQVSVFMNTILASLSALAGEGAVAALYFANRLVQLPLALFGVASAQASLPALSEQAARRDFARFRTTLLAVVRMVSFITCPAAVGLFVLAEPIVRICLERGAFDAASSAMTAHALRFFAVGLLAFSFSKVFTGAFYALQDTRTPVRLALEALGVNLVFALLLLAPMDVGGLALATSMASLLNAWRLVGALERRLADRLMPELIRPLSRIVLASLLMGAGCALAWGTLQALLPPIGALSLVILGGMMAYGVSCRLVGVPELDTVLRWLRRILPPSASSEDA